MKGLISVSATGEHCVLAANFEDNSGSISDNTFILLLCNALGTPLDTKQINIEPLYLSVTSSHVIVASRDAFYVWHFRTSQSWTTLRLDTAANQSTNPKAERLYHVDDNPAGGVHSATRRSSSSKSAAAENNCI